MSEASWVAQAAAVRQRATELWSAAERDRLARQARNHRPERRGSLPAPPVAAGRRQRGWWLVRLAGALVGDGCERPDPYRG